MSKNLSKLSKWMLLNAVTLAIVLFIYFIYSLTANMSASAAASSQSQNNIAPMVFVGVSGIIVIVFMFIIGIIWLIMSILIWKNCDCHDVLCKNIDKQK